MNGTTATVTGQLQETLTRRLEHHRTGQYAERAEKFCRSG